jgi:hypothetical protein
LCECQGRCNLADDVLDFELWAFSSIVWMMRTLWSIRLIRWSLLTAILTAAQVASADPPATGAGPPFQYFNFVWINLHSYLYNTAFPTRRGIDQTIPGVTSLEAATVATAIDFYRQHYKDRDLLFDPQLHSITQRVIAAGNAAQLPAAGLPADLRSTLRSVYPIYRKHLWPSQKEENQRWIARNQELMRTYGPAIQRKLEAVLGRRFSDGPYEIYAVHEANWPGGYTSGADEGWHPHTVISSGRSDYAAFAGLEMVFHESMHAGPFDNVQTALDQEFSARGAKDDMRLWHAVLFYSAGEATREVLQDSGIEFQPYEYAAGGPFTRGDWAKVEPTIREHWLPYMQGKEPMQQALAEMVTEVVAAPAH